MQPGNPPQHKNAHAGLWFTAFLGLMAYMVYWGLDQDAQRAAERNAEGDRTEVVTGVTAVVMNQPGRYTVYTMLPDKTLKPNSVCHDMATECVLKADVPEGGLMSMSYRVNPYGFASEGVIHIHGVSSLTGGGWTEQCGKGCTRAQRTQILDGVP